MASQRTLATAGGGLALGVGLAAFGYAGLVAYHRRRYGTAAPSNDDSMLLDRFIPSPEVVEHHRVHIAAPPDVVMTTARGLVFLSSRLVRGIFKARTIVLGGEADEQLPPALVPYMQSIGWVVLAERADREIILGAVTRPWDAAPIFRSLSPCEFAAFREPGYVKIAWTLRADPAGEGESTFHTETRAATTDLETRKRFRHYWSYVAPGVELIRRAMLQPLKKAAEQRASQSLVTMARDVH